MYRKQTSFLNILIFTFIISILLTLVAAAAELDDYRKIAENEKLILFLNDRTTELAVQEKSSGTTWYSNSPDRKKVEKVARGSAKDALSAQFQLSYYLPGNKQMFMNNFSDSLVYDQYKIKSIDNGVSIDYIVGQQWNEEDYVPMVISKKTFEEKVLSKLSKKEQEFILEQYHLFTLKDMTAGDERIDIYNFDEDKILGNKMFVTPEDKMSDSDMEKYILFFLGLYVENRSDIEAIADITVEDLSYLNEHPIYVQKRKVLPWDRDGILEAFKNSGFTPEDVAEDYQKLNLDSPSPNIRVFKTTIEYQLDGENLLVRVPLDKMEYPEDVPDPDLEGQKVTFPVYSLDILQYFGAADSEDDGYMFVPDGAGALIDLNNGKLDVKPYARSLYGLDYALEPRDTVLNITEQLTVPVYGMKKGDRAFMAVIEEGDALATIKADVSGRTNSYNTVYASFITMPKTELVYGIEEENKISRLNLYQSRLPEGNIQIRYSFLDGVEATYIGMAHKYQEYLKNKYKLTRLESVDNYPFMLEIMGAIHEIKPVLGIPRNVVEPVTTFKQTEEIITDLKENNINNIKLRLTGWLRGGEHHFFPDDADLEGKLGSRQDLSNLLKFLNKEDIGIYPDVSFIDVYRNTIFDGFRNSKHSARFLTRKTAVIPEYNVATYQEEFRGEKQILSAKYLPGVVDGFVNDYQKYNIGGLSLKYMGRQLNSDFRRLPEDTVDRQQSLNIVKNIVEKLNKKDDIDLLVETGNSYTLPYVKNIVKMPLFASGINIIDRGVPFLPIALHGYINYSGDAMNIATNQYMLLKYLETGAVPYYRGIYEESNVVKRTLFDDQYALNYKFWLPEASKLYQRLNNTLKETYNQDIVDHKELKERVYQTVYSDGISVIVNYNKKPVEINGIKVKAEDFIVIQGALK